MKKNGKKRMARVSRMKYGITIFFLNVGLGIRILAASSPSFFFVRRPYPKSLFRETYVQ